MTEVSTQSIFSESSSCPLRVNQWPGTSQRQSLSPIRARLLAAQAVDALLGQAVALGLGGVAAGVLVDAGGAGNRLGLGVQQVLGVVNS